MTKLEANSKSEVRIRVGRWFVRTSVFLTGSFALDWQTRGAAPLAENASSPYAAVHNISPDEARWTDGFWFVRWMSGKRLTALLPLERCFRNTTFCKR